MRPQERLRPTGQAELSPRDRYATAKKKYFGVLNNSKSSPLDIEDTFFTLRDTMHAIPDISPASKATSLTIFARQGMKEAGKGGYPGTVDGLQKQVQMVEDHRAIAMKEYPFIEYRYRRGEQHGAPDTRTPVFQAPDGRRVTGDSHTRLDNGTLFATWLSPDHEYVPFPGGELAVPRDKGLEGLVAAALHGTVLYNDVYRRGPRLSSIVREGNTKPVETVVTNKV